MSSKAREAPLRRQAKKLGLTLVKSRARRTHADDKGGYRIIDPWRNCIVAGEKFDLDLDDVQEFLNEYAQD